MSYVLRPYQQALKDEIYAAWEAGQRNVLAVLPTGGGKTVTFSDILAEATVPSIAIVHRSELVGQISLALARDGVRHNIIAPRAVVQGIVASHLAELGRSFYAAGARCYVAGVDTLVRLPTSTPWLAQIGLWVTDEAHHLTAENKWGKAVALFPNARGLGVTATPFRSDGLGLGSHHDGVMDCMVVGPTMRELIDAGQLCDYAIYCPPSDLDLSSVSVTSTGDYSPVQLAAAVGRSHIHGDIVDTYVKRASGLRGVTFAVNIAAGDELVSKYRAAGVAAELLTGKTPGGPRRAMMAAFRAGSILQLVSVDVVSEGFDIPAIECVSFGRPTASRGLYWQQLGRSLRTLPGKKEAIVFDHVRNVFRHGLPDAPMTFTLDRREKRAKTAADDAVPVRSCPECLRTYERVHAACPYCKHEPVPATRKDPAQVDGDLEQLDADTLRRLRGMADIPLRLPEGVPSYVIAGIKNKRAERDAAQSQLRNQMAVWLQKQLAAGDSQSMAQRRFFLRFGLDVLTARTLNRKDTESLLEKMK